MPSAATISRSYHFESAHFLPHVPENHKCKRMHGHSYVVTVKLSGAIDKRGFVIDFAELDEIVDPLIKECDHKVLNDFIPNPTAELIAAWFLERLEGPLGRHDKVEFMHVRVNETVRAYAEVSASLI